MKLSPAPNSPEELGAFERLQSRLAQLFRVVNADPRIEHTVVVVPSLSMDPRELAKVTGVHHYEERLLFYLMLLRHPRTRVIFVTSQQINPTIVDYYLHLLTGVPSAHARKRLLLFDCGDASNRPLTEKILLRPRLVQRLRRAIGEPERAHLVVFNSTGFERSLAVQLNIPLYANDPHLGDLGTKSGCREIFREAGVILPRGFERLRSANDIAEALTDLKRHKPSLRRAVVKLNDGFSGEGNALFYFDGLDGGSDLQSRIRARLPGLRFEAPAEHWESFQAKYEQMGGVVEEFVEGENKRSPSSHCRVNPVGQAQSISTHDQVLGGPSGQVFLGCTFPADAAYRAEIQEAGLAVARVMADRGVIGRFATDFVSVPDADTPGGFIHYAIEVNLRKGGTTHPFLTLRFLTDGSYDTATGEFYSQTGTPKYYFASDTIQNDAFKGLLPEDLIDIAVLNRLHFHGATERGVVFHLMGALSEFGKLGMVCIGDNLQQARFLYKTAVSTLYRATGLEPVAPGEAEPG